MFVSRLSCEEQTGRRVSMRDISDPTVDQIASSIAALDEKTRTVVMLYGKRDAHMAVGGGNGMYIVYATYGNDEFFNLLAPSAADDHTSKVDIYIGGQLGDYPARQCVDLASATKAALAFAVDGALDPTLAWERQ
jgi:Immunity protein Imm1